MLGLRARIAINIMCAVEEGGTAHRIDTPILLGHGGTSHHLCWDAAGHISHASIWGLEESHITNAGAGGMGASQETDPKSAGDLIRVQHEALKAFPQGIVQQSNQHPIELFPDLGRCK